MNTDDEDQPKLPTDASGDETPRRSPSGRFSLDSSARERLESDTADIPKSIRNRFQNLDFEDVPGARPARPGRPIPAPAPTPAPIPRRDSLAPAARQPEQRRVSRPREDSFVPPIAEGVHSRRAAPQHVIEPRVGWMPPSGQQRPPQRRSGEGRLHISSADAVTPAMRRLPPPEPSESAGQAPSRRTPGITFEEIIVGAGRRPPAPLPFEEDRRGQLRPSAAQSPERGAEQPWPQERSGGSPVTLSGQAARRIRLMAHQAGVPGAGLRLLVPRGGSQTDCEFVFEAVAEPDDVVVLEQGVHIYLDPVAFDTLRGVHITFDTVPGFSGFGIGRRRGDS